jgi:hypothetical protein
MAKRVGLRHDFAVYFGLADEDEESRRERSASAAASSTTAILLRGVLAAVLVAAVIGVLRCLLDGETVTVARVIEEGWLFALILVGVSVAQGLWDRRPRY